MIVTRRSSVLALVLLCAPVPARSQAGQVLSLPMPPGATTSWPGSISPDGRHYVYEVGFPDTTGALLVLDVASGTARTLTAGRERRMAPAWSPDGSRLAYWRLAVGRPLDMPDPDDGIRIVDLASGSDRLVYPDSPIAGYAHSPHWAGTDSIRFEYSRTYEPGRDETWIVAADGSGARPAAGGRARPDRAVTVSGGRTAVFEGCCDAAVVGVWIQEAGREDRCLAGPFRSGRQLVWAADERRLFLRGTEYGASAPGLYLADVEAGGAVQVDRPPGDVVAVTAAANGLLAVELWTDGGPRTVWIVREEDVSATVPSLTDCPSVHPEAARFARDAGLAGTLQISETLRLEDHAYVAYSIGYGGTRLRTAVSLDGHFGWVGPECHRDRFWNEIACPGRPEEGITFRVRPDETHAWSSDLLDALRDEGHRDVQWVRVLLATPDLPDAALDTLTALGHYADQLIEVERVAERADLLARIHAGRGRAAGRAFDLLWALGPAVLDEAVAFPPLDVEIAQAVLRRAGTDDAARPMAAALLDHPIAGRNVGVLTRLLQAGPLPAEMRREAGHRLLSDPDLSETTLAWVMADLTADPVLSVALFESDHVATDERLLMKLARTPAQEWRVAERARQRLRVLWQPRELQARQDTARVMLPGRPIAIPDAWSDGAGPPAARQAERTITVALRALDPIFDRPWQYAMSRATREENEREVCALARTTPSMPDLAAIAEGAVYATSTRVAACVLENPAIGTQGAEDALRLLATMVDVNADPAEPRPTSPSVSDIRNRASSLLRR